MLKWRSNLYKTTGLNPFIWVILFILPFYYIFRTSTRAHTAVGIGLIILFFVSYVLVFVTKGWKVYVWSGVQIAISIAMTVLFGFVYFSLLLTFVIGNIVSKKGFITLYVIHLTITIIIIDYAIIVKNPVVISQLPFVMICLIMVILLPISNYNRNKNEQLQGQLNDANKRISELVKLEERQRIARDLHDTLGQKLSLIGLKSDLALKLMNKDSAQSMVEMKEVRQTARNALKEVRQIVTQMRGARLTEEIARIEQMLRTARIELIVEGDLEPKNLSLMNENVLCMCLKEAVTNLVKHSGASICTITIRPDRLALVVIVVDNGIGMSQPATYSSGSGLIGMKERLEFINGSLELGEGPGTALIMTIPNTQPREKA
ncbi:two-component system sensor histidine kinase DesK [Paenibacillus cellulosilyticus]|uniref:histidine kinase n=1 Tax=Paenibacillus cellulosilyticus TaxID=375489 RepID=A0A2V2YSU0_9BACL|nr:sensor histidine kinase [Paenibacillus cellulosilyticus]PWW02378.1 two-component system sensor histidine kinase DesK [Paenibacillus cellulosilyticus]QKS47091.1 sensor histidine kinase [Paenibacillus cellulosilyticus]